MSVEQEKLYRELQQHLDTMPVGFPSTRSGVEIRLLKYLFTPEEAEIVKNLSYSLETLEIIYERVERPGMKIGDLERILDSCIKKGTIHFLEKEGRKFYSNAEWLVGIYEMQLRDLNDEFLALSHQYFDEVFDKSMFQTGISQFRVIPIGESIPREHRVATYNDLRNVIESAGGPITVMECLCRKKKDMEGMPCKRINQLETCFALEPMLSRHLEGLGIGHVLSKDEALELLTEIEKAGLILQPGNSKRPGFICCCCDCCCGIVRGLKGLEKPISLFHTNYHSEVDRNLCIGCGTCVDRCMMDALMLDEDISMVNLDRCIGCGACVTSCPEEAIHLVKNEKEYIPPEDWDALYKKIGEVKAYLKEKGS